MEEDYEIVEWEEGRIDSIWDWAEADIVQTLGIKGANNAGLTLCRRRSRLKGSPLESQLFVCKALNGTRHQGMRSVKRELDMLRACVHPNILGYEDFSYNGKTLDGMNASLYTEHCAYGDLDQFRFAGNKSQQKLSFQEGAQVFRQLAQALLYIHHGISITDGVSALAAKGQTESFSGSREQDRDWQTILHRDIKPSNVFVAEWTPTCIQVKLGDFGLARLDSDESFTYVGTRNWLAPEQRHSNLNLDTKRRTTLKSDIYSLGLTMAAVLPQMDSAQRQPPAMAQLYEDIRQLVGQCQHIRDTLRPSSLVILKTLQPQLRSQDHIGLFGYILESHLRPPGAPLPADFWTHETFCRLCRRILKAGGAEYVDHVDQIREEIDLTAAVPVPRPSHPSSANMTMSDFTGLQHKRVKRFRAQGADRASAILCTKAIAALPGTYADGSEVALLVHKGFSFEAAIIQVRQQESDNPEGIAPRDSPQSVNSTMQLGPSQVCLVEAPKKEPRSKTISSFQAWMADMPPADPKKVEAWIADTPHSGNSTIQLGSGRVGVVEAPPTVVTSPSTVPLTEMPAFDTREEWEHWVATREAPAVVLDPVIVVPEAVLKRPKKPKKVSSIAAWMAGAQPAKKRR